MSRQENRFHNPETDGDWEFFAEVVARKQKEEEEWRSFFEAKKAGLKEQEIKIREDFSKAYFETFGKPIPESLRHLSSYNDITVLIALSEKDVGEYREHGLTVFHIEFPHADPVQIVIDLEPLSKQIVEEKGEEFRPRFAWIKNRKEESLNLIISSRKQMISKDAVEFNINNSKVAEGLQISFCYKQVMGSLYETSVTPLTRKR